MVRINLTEENLISTAGVADRRFADHSGSIQHGYELGSLTRGLVAYYPMEKGQGQVLHDGATGNVASLINNPTWRGTGQVGSDSLDFAGASADEYAIASGWKGILGSQNRTVSFWVRVDDSSNTPGFIAWGDASVSGAQFKMRSKSDGTARLENGNGSINGTTPIDDGNFHHVVYVLNGSSLSDVDIYVDGVDDGSSGATSAIDTQANVDVTIGAAGGGTFDHLDGAMDDVRIYDRALSQPEIEVLAGLTEPSGFLVEEQDVPTLREFERDLGGAVSRYEFENDVTDSWGDNDGTDNTSAGFVDGVYGQSKDFNLTNNDHVDIGNFGFGIGTTFTISAWFNPDDLSNPGHSIIGKFDGTDDQIQLYARDDNDVVFQLGHSGGNQLSGVGGNISIDNWYHAVAIYKSDPPSVELYFNGSLVDTDSGTPDDFDTSANLTIGSNSGTNNYFDGQIDDVRIYDRALDPIEVEQLFNKGAYRIKRGNL